ncbi:MAG TPA: SusC/RagA family TonB-linked outer membrane protein [Puia sp.]|nr:SusC/RagA family TonB-linked outer membrane protein [Puia sp.]
MRKLHCLLLGIILLIGEGLFAQNVEVTGKVTDPTGSPIPNATIKIKGIKAGTSADLNGAFKIKAPGNAVLIISGIGYENKEVKIGGVTSLSIQLNTDSKSLSEVVVTGVGVATNKKKLGISVESVTADKMPAAPSASVDQALVGKIPGAQISSVSGVPGQNVNILLRGINTLQNGTSPMILLDGIQLAATNLNTIDLSTIERVEVVQGAASAALYGAQGANGVIQLFSKKGKPGKINIDVSSNATRNSYLNIGHVHKAAFHSLVTDANNNVLNPSGGILEQDPATGLYNGNVVWNSTDPTNINNKAYNANLKYYDHFKQFFVAANTINNSIALSGSKDKSDFFVSASNNYQESNFKNNGYYTRNNFLVNVGMELAKGLRFRTITQLAYTRNTLLSDQGFIYELNNSRPFANYNFLDQQGNHAKSYGSAVGVNGSNPNYDIQYEHYVENKLDAFQTLDLAYKFPKFVDLDVKYGLNYENDPSTRTYDNQSTNANAVAKGQAGGGVRYYNSVDLNGEIQKYQFDDVFQNLLATANIHFDLQNDFKLNIPLRSNTQVSFDWRHDKENYYDAYTVGLPAYTPVTPAEGESYQVFQAGSVPFITYGYLVNERIEYGDIAGVAGGFRTDYSSAFGAGHTPFTFPNVNGYFRIGALPFWQDGKIGSIISEFKVRGAYGEAGIQPKPFDRYITLSTANLGNNNAFYFGSQQPNPNLSVEVSEEKEVGADLVFNVLKGNWLKTISLNSTYWSRKTKNAIWAVDVAPTTGIGTEKNNAFSLGSNGIQFSLNLGLLSSKNLSWNFTTNFGHQSSKILSTDGPPVVLTAAAGSTGYVLQAGEKVGQLFGYYTLHSVDAIDKTTGQPFIAKANQAAYSVASNGIVVNTASKQPYVTPNLYSFGDPNPKFNASFINEFAYKGYLTLAFQFDWLYGSHIYNQTKEWMYRDGISGDYDKPVSIGGGTPEAWTAFYRGMYAQVSRNGTKNYFYEDASFLRLRNLAVGFDFAKAFNLKGFRKLQLVVGGRNLWTKTKYTGMDPEVSSVSTTASSAYPVSSGASSSVTSSAWDRGTDHNTLPNYKSYQIGLNVGL